MSADMICLLALLVGGLAPWLVVAGRGTAASRLVGLDAVACLIVYLLLLFSRVGPGQGYDLILPLVLALLSFAGTLVFTRLLAPSNREG